MTTPTSAAIKKTVANPLLAQLFDPKLSIGGGRFDAVFFWGVPLLSLIFVQIWFGFAAILPAPKTLLLTKLLIFFVSILTYAHLIAAVPRAYFNTDVFRANKLRLTLIPLLLIFVLIISRPALICAACIAVLWDVHHSAMQNFGLARIYDMKAGNDPQTLRTTDLRLNWVLYVGPLAAGASLMKHLHSFDRLDQIGFSSLAQLPGLFEGHLTMISGFSIAAWVIVLAWSAWDYRTAFANGYRLPVHKAVLTGITGMVSLIAWGFLPPIVALAAINIYHALQYFALVWLKESGRMMALRSLKSHITLLLFVNGCAMFGLAYFFAGTSKISWIIAPFVACSLLHFWYDGFIWSVGKKQV
jgi:hypothetical protein